MSNFALNTTDPYGDVISSINYLLATTNVLDANAIVASGNALVGNVSSGQITTAADPDYLAYLYQYIDVRYADSATGSVNFSTSPTNRLFFGIRNTTTSGPGSNNPADYVYTQVVGGFGTTKFLYYQTNGGRQIQFSAATSPPSSNFVIVTDATSIDLDVLSATLVASTLSVIYSNGQFFNRNTAGFWSPNAVGNIVSTVANSVVIRSNAVVAQVVKTINYNTAAETWSVANTGPDINSNSFTFSTPVINNEFSYFQPFSYNDIYANLNNSLQVSTVESGANGATGTNGLTLYSTYDIGQFFQQGTDGVWVPAANASGYVNGNVTVTAVRGNTITGQITRDVGFLSNSVFVTNTSTPLYGLVTTTSGVSLQTSDANYRYISFFPTLNSNIVVTGGNATVDMIVVGSGNYGDSVGPGAGGQVNNWSNVLLTPGTYGVNVGQVGTAAAIAAGQGQSNVTVGSTVYNAVNGSTRGTVGSFANNSFGAYANAGAVSTANIAGAPGPANAWGANLQWAVPIFNNTNNTVNNITYFGGGGGSYAYTSATNGAGGLGGGGNGGAYSSVSPPLGLGYGGGGGGAAYTASVPFRTNFNGQGGIVIIRQPHDQANIANLWSSQWTMNSSNVTDINANSFTYADPNYTTFNYARDINYNDGISVGNLTVSYMATPTNPGATGSRGFVPLAYVVTSSDPTSFSNAQYTTAFSAPRANTVAPIGTGYTPITGDTAQFIYTTTNAFVVKTFDANTNGWTTANGQVISGNLIVTGTITSAQLNTNDIYTLNIQSTNANIGNVNSNGFWLQSNTGDARFGGNTSIGNNLTVGNNATIGGNLFVSGLITSGNLNNSTVATDTIQSNAVSFFTGYQNNAELITLYPTANTFYSLTNAVSITTTVTNTKIVVTGQALNITVANTASATDSWTSNMGIRMFDSSANVTYILTSEATQFTPGSAGNLLQGDHAYYETGVVLTLTNIATYTFGVYGYVQTSGNTVVVATDAQNRRNAVQNLKR
jgi:hypothetical protein